MEFSLVDRFVTLPIKEAPSVRGDGVHTVRELVDLLNANRHVHGLAASGFRRPVCLDSSAQVHLSGLGLTQESVLEDGRSIRVRSNSNLSTGGECIDVTARVHGQVRQYAEALAHALNPPMLGLDYMTEDISGPPQGGGGQFVEINTTPGLGAMIAAGWTVEEAGDCALGQATGRIPVDVVVVADADLPDFIRRMREHRWAPRHGWAASGCAATGGLALQVISDHPWSGMRVLFGHRHLDHAVLVAGDRQVLGHGLPVDRCRNLWLCGDLPSRWQEALAMHALQLHAVRPHESVLMSDRWFRSIFHRQIEG
jgi:cyanophycin synthetase